MAGIGEDVFLGEGEGEGGGGGGGGGDGEDEWYYPRIRHVVRNAAGRRVEVESEWVVHSRYTITSSVALGTGAYGTVVGAYDNLTGLSVAIKRVERTFGKMLEGKRLLREIKLLRRLQHPNIIGLVDIMKLPTIEDHVYLVFELMDTDLQWVLKSGQSISEEHIQFFMHQLLLGLLHLKENNIVHRDLKPGNILVNEDCMLKICDFGLARCIEAPEDQNNMLSLEMSQYVVTRWYRAPELLMQSRYYDFGVDMWAAGCIFSELYNLSPLFPGTSHVHQLSLIMQTLGTPDPDLVRDLASDSAADWITRQPFQEGVDVADAIPNACESAKDLLRSMLAFHPKDRITVEDALQHPFFETSQLEVDEPDFYEIDFSFDQEVQTIDDIKASIWEEMVYLHPELEGGEEQGHGEGDEGDDFDGGFGAPGGGGGAAAGGGGGMDIDMGE